MPNDYIQDDSEPISGDIIDELPDAAADESDGSDGSCSGDLASQLQAERDKYLRLAAEYDNYRKRSAKERESVYADARADTVTKFLQVYDNLARALSHETADDAYRKGVEMTMSQFMDVLGKLGVSEIPALGEKFNPEAHNAIVHEEDDSENEGLVTEEFQKGFKLGDKIIRFSLVKVVN